MTRNRIIGLVVAVLLVAGVVVLMLMRAGSGQADSDVAPTATVTTAPVQSQPLKDTVTTYGVVQADPAASLTLAAPRAVIVSRVLVQAGQSVKAGQALIEVANAPAAELAYRQAADAAAFAQTDLARVQRLYDDHLAASDQLSAAKKALSDAQAGLDAQRQQGGARRTELLTAQHSAVVASIAIAPGDHVAQDGPLLVLAQSNALSVKLGLEAAQNRAAVGDPVTVRPVNGGPPIASRLTMVGRVADPAAKTIQATAPIGDAGLAIGAPVQADVAVSAHDGLVVPRAAVVFDETGAHLFVVAGGKARRVFVTPGRDYGDQTEVSGPIAAGQRVAVEGAYELQDGMAVKVAGQ
ncbi:MAG TPA: efflux RND transporter periplasmic adaptor subunit [Caulobacteraceae bacterium]|jgi:RND family efflux transporter MFP subunit|nr:efflux RND transporter periplasmic adaptor subunit [Caulobacteraceae bacterium]